MLAGYEFVTTWLFARSIRGGRKTRRVFRYSLCLVASLCVNLPTGAFAESPVVLLRPVETDQGRDTLELEEAALAALHSYDILPVQNFPLGAGRVASLTLHRFDPLGDKATIRVGIGPTQPIDKSRLPRYFRAATGDAIVMLADRGATIDGFVQTGGELRIVRPDGDPGSRRYALESVAPDDSTITLHRCQVLDRQPSASVPPQTEQVLYGGTLAALVALDVSAMINDQLGGYFEVLTFALDLIAAHSARLQAEIPMSLELGMLQVWTGSTMPYNPNEDDYEDLLDSVKAYWELNYSLVPRDVVIMLWKPNQRGGIAWLRGACSPRFDYGMADVLVGGPYQDGSFGHELGHTLGAPHSHCLSPPEDFCADDPGRCTRVCIGGTRDGLGCELRPDNCPGGTCDPQYTCALSQNNGTPCSSPSDCRKCHLQDFEDITGPPGASLMSYCTYQRFEYGTRISETIRDYVTASDAACLRPTQTITATLDADTHSLSMSPNTPQNQWYDQMGRHRSSGKGSTLPFFSHGYLSVDLNSHLAASSFPVRAILRVYIDSIITDPGLPRPSLILRRTGTFNEATLTWNNAPSLITGSEEVVWTPSDEGWAAVNVTTLVQDCWYDRDGLCNWGIREVNDVDNTNSYILFRSKEDPDPSYRPRVEVEYAP